MVGMKVRDKAMMLFVKKKKFHKIAQKIPRKCVLPLFFIIIHYALFTRYIHYTLDFLWSKLMKQPYFVFCKVSFLKVVK